MSTNKKELGRLKQVKEVGDIWPNEADDFTPWLAGDENLALLGETIGMDLELEAIEKDVGPFRADILCKESNFNELVLIENQLEKTDHTHLGQLLTYAAGLKTVSIVWIAKKFTEEHRAALDWLNDITDKSFNFFGLEVELWQIGDSAIAPKFNIACKPNEWTKRPPDPIGPLSDAQALKLEYWTQIREILLERSSPLKSPTPGPHNYQNFAVGRFCFGLNASIRPSENYIQVQITSGGEDAKPHYYLLQADKKAIEQEMGEPLEWREQPGRKTIAIALVKNSVDPTDKGSWPEQHRWMADKLERFHKVFSQRVKRLDAEDYEESNED